MEIGSLPKRKHPLPCSIIYKWGDLGGYKMKVCSKCGIEKKSTNEFFSIKRDSKDGLKTDCKSCQALYRENNKERYAEYHKRYQQVNKESILERTKQYHKENKEHKNEYNKQYYKDNKESFAEQSKQYQQENKERLAEYNKQYRKNNKELLAEYKKQYSQENPEKCVIYKQRREARKRQLDSTLTFEQWENIKQDFNHKCAYCGKEDKLQQEHLLPLSKGGEYTHNNIIPACGSCNSGKGNKLFHEWYPKYKHYSKKREKQLLQYLGYNNNIQQLSIL